MPGSPPGMLWYKLLVAGLPGLPSAGIWKTGCATPSATCSFSNHAHFTRRLVGRLVITPTLLGHLGLGAPFARSPWFGRALCSLTLVWARPLLDHLGCGPPVADSADIARPSLLPRGLPRWDCCRGAAGMLARAGIAAGMLAPPCRD